MSRVIKDYCPLRCKLSKYILNLQIFYNIFQNYLLFLHQSIISIAKGLRLHTYHYFYLEYVEPD